MIRGARRNANLKTWTIWREKASSGWCSLSVALAIFLFAPAWTLDCWQAWIYLLVFAAAVMLITLYLWKNDRELLDRRVNIGPAAEKEKNQKRIQTFVALAFSGTYLLPSLDHRFAWSRVPLAIVIFFVRAACET